MAILGLGFVFLVGCGEGATVEEAGEMFMDRLIYDKKSENFTKTFEEVVELDKLIKKSNISFTKEFIKGFNSSSNSSFSKEKAEELGKIWKTKVEKETKYKIANVEEQKNQYVVHYEINGLDFVAAYKVMLNTVMEKIIVDPVLAANEEKANQLIIDETINAISEIKVGKKPIKTKLNFAKKGSKYLVLSDESENIQSIFFITYLGQKDDESLDNEIAKIGKEIEEKMSEKITNE